ncbi:MAG TPA: sugar ABC transporter substrate-binding protein [Nocardioidaceae bacterium]|nr:sugar ABC transporter substrate-binding protein [Nocardioidaceae bacterium]
MNVKHLAGVALFACLVASCATSTNESDDTSDSGDSEGPVTLRFNSLAFQEPTIEASKAIVDAWNAEHPDIQVEYVQGSWDSVHDQLVTQLQTGKAPDIIHDESADISGFARQGYLADLSPYLSDEVKDAVPEGVWDAVTVDDKVIAAPTLLQSYMVFANTDLLQQAGVDIPAGETWAWDDFQAAAAKATTDDTYGVAWGLAEPTATVTSLGMNFGATFFDGEGDDADITVGDPELALPARIHEMTYDDQSIDPTSLTLSGSDALPGFLHGKYAMTVQGSYVAQQLVQDAPEDFHWAVLPPLSAESAAQAANPQTLSVPAESPHVEEAAEFIDYFMAAQNLAKVAEGDWLIPASSEASDAVAADTGGDNGWNEILNSGEYLTKAPFQSVTNYPQWDDQIATPALQKYFADEISLDELQAELTDGWADVSGG